MESSTFGRFRCSTAMDGVSPGRSQLVSGDGDLPSSARSTRFVIPRGGRSDVVPDVFPLQPRPTAVAWCKFPTLTCPPMLLHVYPPTGDTPLLRHISPLSRDCPPLLQSPSAVPCNTLK